MGFESSDDAGVYRLNETQAIVTTADFITPPVDDPFVFGQIAAANALSDVYAMGGTPLTCLNLVGFPSKKLKAEVLQKIVAGALSKITESGAVLVGGHSTEDEEPKFGLSVTGIVHPDQIWRNTGAQVGDLLILTKPIGSGVLFNANRKNWVSEEAFIECISVIKTLNKTAAETMSRFTIHGATDITGFGLAGHALEMALGSKVSLEIDLSKVPIMREALEMYERGMTTGVNHSNRKLVEKHSRFNRELPRWHQEIVMDPQTSGGLFVSVPENEAESLLEALQQAGVFSARIIGCVQSPEAASIIFK